MLLAFLLSLPCSAQPPEGKPLPCLSSLLPTVKENEQLKIEVVKDKKTGRRRLVLALRYRSKGRWRTKSLPAKVVIFLFWHSRNYVSARLATILAGLHEKYAKKGLVIIGVNVGESRSVAARASKNFPFITVVDPFQTVSKPLRVTTVPVTVVVDWEGMVRFARMGCYPTMPEEIEAWVKMLVEE